MADKKNPFSAGGLKSAKSAPKKPVEQTKPEVPAGSVSEVLAWVESDLERAQMALDAERAGHGRKTLIAKLSELLDESGR